MQTLGGAAADEQRRRIEKDRAKRRAALQKQREARTKRAERAFEKFSEDGAVLPESHVEDFFAEVVKVERGKLEPNAVELVTNTAHASAKNEGGGDGLTKSALLGAVEKYGEYVRRSKEIDDMFKKFDVNKDGELSRPELKEALQAREKADESGLRVDDEDIEFLLAKCDADQGGTIGRSEVLPAIAAWEELRVVKIKKKKKSMCIIL